MERGVILALLTIGGCGKVTMPGEPAPDPEDAVYFREQARQVFGTDLVRVEPLRDAMLTPEEYSKIRRQLDLRVVASSAPKPGPTLMARQFDKGGRWSDGDRPAPARNEGAGPLASSSRTTDPGGLPQELPGSKLGPGEANAPIEDDSIAQQAVSDGGGGRSESPWEIQQGRERRARARAVTEAAGQETESGASRARSSGTVEIDPAFADSILSTNDLPTPRAERASNGDARASRPATAAENAKGWSIILAVFNGEKQAEMARDGLEQIQREGRLPEAYLVRRGKATAVCYGHYADADDADAQADLRRVQAIEINGEKPYATTYLMPGEEGAAKNALDLRAAKKKYGKDALYTLQVGFYGREEVNQLSPEDRKAIQAAAEQAAADLRRDGELAFFYHGRNRSMVTVGVFGADDFNPMNPSAESKRLSETRRRHPLNLYNGQGYTGKTPGMREAKLVPSALVAVPEK